MADEEGQTQAAGVEASKNSKRPFSQLEEQEREQLIVFTKMHRIEPAPKKQKDCVSSDGTGSTGSTSLAPLFGTLPWSLGEDIDEALRTTVDGVDSTSAANEDAEDAEDERAD